MNLLLLPLPKRRRLRRRRSLRRRSFQRTHQRDRFRHSRNLHRSRSLELGTAFRLLRVRPRQRRQQRKATASRLFRVHYHLLPVAAVEAAARRRRASLSIARSLLRFLTKPFLRLRRRA